MHTPTTHQPDVRANAKPDGAGRDGMSLPPIFFELQRAIAAARSRTGDAALSVGAESGMSRVVRVVKIEGKSTRRIDDLSGLISHQDAIAFLNELGA